MEIKAPYHLGIIMDGNRRWAKKHGQGLLKGHSEGVDKVKKIGRLCRKLGVKILTLYTFSTENWKRPKREVNYLVNLVKESLNDENVKELNDEGIKVVVIGQKNRFSDDVREVLDKAENITKGNQKGILNIALSYGGREEIVEAVKRIIKKRIAPEKVTEDTISDNLWIQKDPDLIIRTSGEKRLSNFLTWQSAYSELYFTDKYWPDFEEEDLKNAFLEYTRRRRRFGK